MQFHNGRFDALAIVDIVDILTDDCPHMLDQYKFSTACVCMEQGTTYVLNVVVSKKHRKRGIGRALMTAVGKLAKEQWGSDSMCTHVSAQNEALPYYPSCTLLDLEKDADDILAAAS